MEELQPSIQSGRSRFSVHDATGFSGHVSCSGLPGAPSTCSAWSSVSSSTDVYADMFRSFSGDREAPSVPFLEFSGDLEVEDIARISVDSYSDIFGGLGWDVEMSAEELMLGGLGFGAESKDVENDSLKKTRGERKPSQELPAEFVSYASEDSNGSLFYSWENITSKTKSQNVYNDEEQIQIPDKVFNHVDEGKFMDENDTIPVDSFSVFTSTDDGCYSSLEEHKKRATTLLDRLSVDSLPCVRGNNLEEGDCNRCARSDHVEMLSAYRQNSGNNNSCEPREVFLTVAEINLQTKPTKRPPPSRSPPQLETRESESKGSLDSSRKVYHENGIRKMVNRNQCDRATIGSSDIHVVEDSSKIPPCLDVGIDTNPYVSDSTHSTEEVRIEAKGEEKIPTHSSQTGRNTHGNMMSCAEDGHRSKQQNECKTIHESFESAETDSAVSNRQYRQDKVGRKTYQETQEPTEPLIKLKEEQQNYDYKNVFRISCDGIQFEASRRMRNAPLIIRKEVEVASLDKSSGEKAFEQDVLTRETSVLQTGGQAWKQTGETAMVDKVVLEARDCVEVELAEMQTTSSRDMENEDDQSESCDKPRTEYSMRHEPAFKQKNPPSDVSFLASETVTNRPEFESETEGRRKARLLRSQRTEERVAKALAEKKARDFLVQKEQAQRSRLAETLDGDIRRWSIGKEGNLRALLSTLQYILWPESGWHPVPLTEVITAAAVKKTYRKATLCVHPDKVQQKGANIQQKYIAEKVFYLLKDAWNKFNYEEC